MSTKTKKDKGVKNDPFRFEGDGISFKGKLIGSEAVSSARGDRMCADAMARLKSVVKASGEHKQRVSLTVSLEGIKVFDEKTHELMCHHPVHRISFISQDQTDPRAFGYVSGTPLGGHSFIAIKTEKTASQIVIALRDLFQVVLEMKQHEMKRRSGSTSHQSNNTSGSNNNNAISNNSSNRHSSSSSSANHENGHEDGRIDGSLLDPARPVSNNVNVDSMVTAIAGKGQSSTESSRPDVAVVDDLLDLQTELDCLQQGIEQIEGEISTAEAAFGADPFGSTHEVAGQQQASTSSMLESNAGTISSGSSAYFQPNKVCLPPVSSAGPHTSGSSTASNFSPAQTTGANLTSHPSMSVGCFSISGQSALLLPPPPTSSLPSTPKRTQTRQGGGSTSADLFTSSSSSATIGATSAALARGVGASSLDASSNFAKGPQTTASMTLPKGFTPGGMPSASWAESNSTAPDFTAQSTTSSYFGFGDSFDDNFGPSASATARSLADGGPPAASFGQQQEQRQQQQSRSAGVTGLFSQTTSRGSSIAPPASLNQTQFSFEGSSLLAGGGSGMSATLPPPPPVGGHQRGAQPLRSTTTSSSSSSSAGATMTVYNTHNASNNLNSVLATGLVESLARTSVHGASVSELLSGRPYSSSREHATELTSNRGVLSATAVPVSGTSVEGNGRFNAVFENARPNSGLIGQVAPAASVDSVFDDFHFDGGASVGSTSVHRGPLGGMGSHAPYAHQGVQREAHFSAAQFSFESVASSSNLSRGRTQESTELFDPPPTNHSTQFDIAPLVKIPPAVSGSTAAAGGAVGSAVVASEGSGMSEPTRAAGAVGSSTVHSGSEFASPRFMPTIGSSTTVSANRMSNHHQQQQQQRNQSAVGNLATVVAAVNAPMAVGSVPPADKYAVFEKLKQEEQAAAATPPPLPPPLSPPRTQQQQPAARDCQIGQMSISSMAGAASSAPSSLFSSVYAAGALKSADLFANFNAFGTSSASMPAGVVAPSQSSTQVETIPPGQRLLTGDLLSKDSGITAKSVNSSATNTRYTNSANTGFESTFESNFVSSAPLSQTICSGGSSPRAIQPQSKSRNTQTTINDFFGESIVAFEAHFDVQFPTQSNVQSGDAPSSSSVTGAGAVLMSHGSTASSNSNGSETGSVKRPPMLNAAMRSNPFCALSTESTPSEDFNTPPISTTTIAPQPVSIHVSHSGQVCSGLRGQKGVTSSSNDNSVCSPSEATTATNEFISAASSPSSDRFVTMASGSSLSSSENDLTSSSPPPTVAPSNPTRPPSSGSSCQGSVAVSTTATTTAATTATSHPSIPPAAFPPFAFDAPVAPAVTFASPVAVIPPSPAHAPPQCPAKPVSVPDPEPFSSDAAATSHRSEAATTPHPHLSVSTAANPFCMGSFAEQVTAAAPSVNKQQQQQALNQLSNQGGTTFVVQSSEVLDSDKDRDEGFFGSNTGSVSPYPTVLSHVHQHSSCPSGTVIQKLQASQQHPPTQQQQTFPSGPNQLPPKVTSCALESRNGSAGGAPFGHTPFVTHFPAVFPENDETQPAVSVASPPPSGIFSKKDDPFNEDFFNMLNSSAGPDAPGQQHQIDSFWCR
ncbi:mucin-19-like isoform X4 [Varroa destructor]|uniref:PID domain-containing protein n=2 Tax=Varroa TaxID=62624 RepID=A0A7M7K4X5_VARDE|nr:mucin-19-like isoform X4 [Varroa destructor]